MLAAGSVFAVAFTIWAISAYFRRRERVEQLAERARKAELASVAAERERRRQEAEAEQEQLRRQAENEWEQRCRLAEAARQREHHEAFLAAADAKRWRYDIVGECHMVRHKKQFATELDARICTWVQREKHGSPLQRAYWCDGRDVRDGDGCGFWHLTSN